MHRFAIGGSGGARAHRFAIGRTTIGLATAIAGVLGMATPAAYAGAPLPGPNVKIQSDSASIDTFQALNATDTKSRDRDDSDFVRFPESLNPSTLTGPEGKTDAF